VRGSIPVAVVLEEQPGAEPHRDNDQDDHQHRIKQPIHVFTAPARRAILIRAQLARIDELRRHTLTWTCFGGCKPSRPTSQLPFLAFRILRVAVGARSPNRRRFNVWRPCWFGCRARSLPDGCSCNRDHGYPANDDQRHHRAKRDPGLFLERGAPVHLRIQSANSALLFGAPATQQKYFTRPSMGTGLFVHLERIDAS
jgi:hypothetical protein